MVKKIQASFTGGELDPKLWARTDISKYQTGARLLSNFLIHPYGGASNRPGLEFITKTRDPGVPARLVPFDAGNGDSYTLLFSNVEVFFIRSGAKVIRPSGSGAGDWYGIVSPYKQEEVFDLKIQQSNDVLTITHYNHPPRTLSRFDHADWRFADLSFAETVPAPDQVVIAKQERGIQQGEYAWPVVEEYVITNVDGETGRESLASAVFSQEIDLALRGFYVIIQWRRTYPNTIRSNVYKKKGGVFGLVGQGSIIRYEDGVAIYRFEDRNISPDMTQGLQNSVLPFQTLGTYPECSTYYQQRRIFAGAIEKPNRVRASQSSDYNNFNVSFPTRDSDALDFSIAQERRQDIKHMISLEDLILFTTSGEWRVRGSQEGLLSPSSIDARLQSQYGCLPGVPPVQINDDIVFVQAKGQVIRSIRYEFSSNKYTGEPLNLLASHLFDGKVVKQMAYAAVPFSVLYCVMNDGSCNAFTYLRDQEVYAWSRINSDGKFVSVTVVQEGTEDVPYFTVARQLQGSTQHCIERVASRRIDYAEDAFFVDCGLRLDDPYPVSSISEGPDGYIVATCPGLSISAGDFIDISGATIVTTYDNDGNKKQTGPYGIAVDGDINRRFKAGSVSSSGGVASVPLLWEDSGTAVPADTFGIYIGGAVARRASATISGLNHLEQKALSGTADGVVVEGLVVVNGSVTLPFPASRVSLGLPYVSEIETLDLDIGNIQANGEPKNISNMIVKVDKTRGLFYSTDADGTKYEMDPRGEKGGEAYEDGSLWTGQFTARPAGDWNHTGRMYIRAAFLPCTVMAIIPDFDAGGAADERQG